MIGTTIGHYRIIQYLGGGGMGVVYRAEDERLGRTVAVKVLAPELTRDEEARKRFLREARAASKLDHQNICTVHEIGETGDGQLFIAMALYEGVTLQAKIAHERMTVGEAAEFAQQVARGLAKAHEQGIVHRDVKPANVIVTTDGVAKILDFGLAKPSGTSTLTKPDMVMGTLAYMAPEQLRGDEVGPAADIWALGVVLYELLTGRRPFKADGPAAAAYVILNEHPRAVREFAPEVPDELERLVKRMLRKDPLQRIASAADVAAELEAFRRPESSGAGRGARKPPSGLREQMKRGARLGPYEVVEPLGSGGMGDVYAARDVRLDRKVAIKVLAPVFSEDAALRERFHREAKTISSLSHTNICTLFDIGEQEGTDFLVMEHLEGETLADRLARGAMPLSDLLAIGVQIGEALSAAHSRGVIHRDLKPANVMLTTTGGVKLLDFGLAKGIASVLEAIDSGGGRPSKPPSQPEQASVSDATARLYAVEPSPEPSTPVSPVKPLTAEGAIVGTLPYMAPEQIEGGEADARSDIFALGAILYEMATGKRAFHGGTKARLIAAILEHDPRPIVASGGPCIPALQRIVSRCLEKDPEKRFLSVAEVTRELRSLAAGESGARRRLVRALARPKLAIPVAVLCLGLVVLGVVSYRHRSRVHWARGVALPEIERMIEENDVWRNLSAPYRLAEKVEEIIPDDPKLAELFSKCSLKINVRTDPPGATVFMKEYGEPDGAWVEAGTSPIERLRVPIGVFRWRLEKEGYETVLAAASSWNMRRTAGSVGVPAPYDLVRTLDKKGGIPPGMVRVQGAETPRGMLGDFLIDRYEVTNRQFKEFIDKGGYRDRGYWKHPIVKSGAELSWEDAIAQFVDQTALPGPSTWQAGDYPEGQAEHPVSGVSWYEAAAYAEFAGKTLPSWIHWGVASGGFTPMVQFPQLGGYAVLASFHSFGGKGTMPVGSLGGITAFGAFDMAGNVREWCWNEAPQGRIIRGGAWNGNTYDFRSLRQAPAMDRSAANGFRCALYLEPAKIPAKALQPEALPAPASLRSARPVDDAIFQVFKGQFAYDRTDLHPRVEERVDSPGGWVREKVSFDAAYGGERVVAYLFLPKGSKPPFQPVIYFPGSASTWAGSSKSIETYYEFPMFLSFLVRNGRAVLYPVYKGTFERGDPALVPIHAGAESHAYTEFLTQLVKDFRRTVDYLETREDIDSRKIAYYGMSWGGVLGTIIPAVEERVKVNVLVAGGMMGAPALPPASPINYITRVKSPTLMLNGRYDRAIDDAIRPTFDMLGTRPEHKKLILYDTDHIPPRNEFVKETLAWLDKYLGPVR